MKKIKLYDKEYPVRNTMGAMRRYKKLTGQDVSAMTGDMDLLSVFLYCCTASACHADGVEFDLDLDTFADGVDMDTLNEMTELLTGGDGDSKKKETEQSPT